MVYKNKGSFLSGLEKNKEAKESTIQANKILSKLFKINKLPYMPLYADNLMVLGMIESNLGESLNADDLLRESINLFEELQEREFNAYGRNYSWALNNFSHLKIKLGQFREAEKLFKRSIEIKEKLPNKVYSDIASIAVSNNNLAIIYHMEKNYEECIKYKEKAFSLYLRLYKDGFHQYSSNVMRSLVDIGEVYRQKEDNEWINYSIKGLLFYFQNMDNTPPQLMAEAIGLFNESKINWETISIKIEEEKEGEK
jgi:tetratricopeptide (TPR) repeat protein